MQKLSEKDLDQIDSNRIKWRNPMESYMATSFSLDLTKSCHCWKRRIDHQTSYIMLHHVAVLHLQVWNKRKTMAVMTASSLSLPASSLPKITQRLPLPACRSLYKNHQRIAAIAYLQTAPCPAHATVSAKSPILHSPGTRQCYESPGKSQTYQEFCVPKTPCTRMHKVLWKRRGKPIVGEGPDTVFNKIWAWQGHNFFFWLLDAFLRSPERNGYGTRTATESYSCSSPKIPRALNFCAAHGGFASPISERLKNLKSAKRFSALHTELIPRNHFGGNQFGTIRNSPGIRCYDPVLQRQQNARGEASCSEHQCSRCHTSPGTDPLNESKL